MHSKPVLDLDTALNKWEIGKRCIYAVRQFPKIWRDIRILSGLSQSKLAGYLGCSQSVVSQIERGTYSPSGLLIDYLLMLSCLAPKDDAVLRGVLHPSDIDTFRNLHVNCQVSPRVEKARYERDQLLTVNRAKLTVVLEGESNSQKFGQTCKWPDCGWTWYPDYLSYPHSETCPLGRD